MVAGGTEGAGTADATEKGAVLNPITATFTATFPVTAAGILVETGITLPRGPCPGGRHAARSTLVAEVQRP